VASRNVRKVKTRREIFEDGISTTFRRAEQGFPITAYDLLTALHFWMEKDCPEVFNLSKNSLVPHDHICPSCEELATVGWEIWNVSLSPLLKIS
jgi:hypothetical protein